MPCSCRKARILLKADKAKIVQYEPFTIQLKYPTGEAMQPITIGVDQGMKHVGIAIVSNDKVLAKGEVELRQDVKSLIDTRRIYRRSRRNRKTRYRKVRFQNRKKKEHWLPPSIEAKIRANFWWVDKFMEVLPKPKLRIEVGKFDPAKMINPEIEGKEYQHGTMYGYDEDVKAYVLERDGYECQVCHKKNVPLVVHHLVYRSKGGTNRPDNLITVCKDCHTAENHEQGGILWRWMIQHKKVKQYKAPTFMSILRKVTFAEYPEAEITYGSITKPKRKELNLPKTHYNDAIAITGIENIKFNPKEYFYLKQFRKKKRSLHEATIRKGRKEPNRTQKRNSKNTKRVSGWYLNDRISFLGQIGWISGFSQKSAYIQDIEGNYLRIPGKTYTQIPLNSLQRKNHSNTWQYQIITKDV